MEGGALLIALAGIFLAFRDFSENLRELKYSELDKLYFELQRAALEFPDARDPPDGSARGRRRRDAQRYDIYANMVWTFLETIHDRCKRDRTLRRTWYPIVEVERHRHRDWMTNDSHARLFKESFKREVVPDWPDGGEPARGTRVMETQLLGGSVLRIEVGVRRTG